MTNLLDAFPRRSVRLDARDYLRLTPEDRAHIAKVRILPPILGSRDFGGFEVTYKRPVFVTYGHPFQ